MTRKKEIEKAAMQVAGVHPDWSNIECFRMGFREGAKYADKTMLDRACEWLYANAENYTIDGGLAIESLIYSFKKAMEGGSE